MCNASGEHSLFFNATYDKDGDLQPATPRLIHCIENLKFAQGTNIIMEPSRAEMRKDINAKFDPHVFDGASYIVSYYFPLQIESNPAKEESPGRGPLTPEKPAGKPSESKPEHEEGKMTKIKASSIKAESVMDIIKELEGRKDVMDYLKAHNLTGDTLEAIAMRISEDDDVDLTDYIEAQF